MRLEVGASQDQTLSISLQQAATKYLSYCQPRMKKNTVRQKAFVFRSLLAFIGDDVPVMSIKRVLLEDYLQYRAGQAGNKVANRDLQDIKAMFNWLIKRELMDGKNPCNPIERFPEDPYIPYIPPADDINKVLAVADSEERDLILTYYHTLARKGEIAFRLQWEDIDFERRTIRLFTRKRSNGELQFDYVPMNATLARLLKLRSERCTQTTGHVFHFSAHQLRGMMARLCKKAQVKPFGFHAIRHHVASVLNASGQASTKDIQALLRHRRQSTTEIYLHVVGNRLYDVLSVLDSCTPSHTLGSDGVT